jgi:U3 small nucleolar RNA-associated protein 5
VLVFDVQANASEQPICVTSTLGVPQSITTRSSGRILDVLLTLEGTGAVIVRIDTGKSLENSMVVSSNISSSGEILAARFAEDSQDSVIFAFGSKEKPKFVRIKFLSSEGTMLDDLVLPTSDSSSSSASRSVDGLRPATVEVLGPSQLGVTKRPHVVNDDLEENSTVAKKQKGSEQSKVADIVAATLTLEERLQNLSSGMTFLENGTVPTRRSLAPTSDSLVTVIDQALQARDDALLEQCLACDDTDVIDQTAKMLHTHRILELMTRLVAKFEKRPSRGLLLTRWLSCLLRHHTSFLVSIPDLAGQLAGLSQMLEQRLASYTRLSSLSGRLDLLLSQASARGMSSSSTRSASMEPLEVVYEE